MNSVELEKLGLNKNESKVYYSLLLKGEATAQELVRSMGVYRNIVYDNLEKLTQKGLVSFIREGKKKKFIAEKPSAIVEFLESKKNELENEINKAKDLIPLINEIRGSHSVKQETTLFKGIAGMKKVLSEIVQAKESWCIGITNESVKLLGETYWKNYNLKKKETKTHEWLLWNNDFRNNVIGNNKKSKHRVLPKELNQVTETILYEDKAAIFVFSAEPIVILIENKQVFEMFRKHFDFLWKLSSAV